MVGSLRIRRESSLSKEDRAGALFGNLERVHAYVSRRIGPPAVVEDITSEVFAVALSSRQPKGDPLPWLYGIARRKIADAFRRRTVRKELPLDHADALGAPTSHDQLVQTDEATRLRDLVDSLEANQREAILLFYVEELSAKQIGISMGRSEHAVNSLLQRAREKLREAGRDYFGEDQDR